MQLALHDGFCHFHFPCKDSGGSTKALLLKLVYLAPRLLDSQYRVLGILVYLQLRARYVLGPWQTNMPIMLAPCDLSARLEVFIN